jgi:hypothetical protein
VVEEEIKSIDQEIELFEAHTNYANYEQLVNNRGKPKESKWEKYQ